MLYIYIYGCGRLTEFGDVTGGNKLVGGSGRPWANPAWKWLDLINAVRFQQIWCGLLRHQHFLFPPRRTRTIICRLLHACAQHLISRWTLVAHWDFGVHILTATTISRSTETYQKEQIWVQAGPSGDARAISPPTYTNDFVDRWLRRVNRPEPYTGNK